MAEYPDALVIELEAHRAGIKRDNEASLATHRAEMMRHVFACHAMEAFIRNGSYHDEQSLAHDSYRVADAMMLERAARERAPEGDK